MKKVKVFVCGAAGKMGRAVVNAVVGDQDLELVGAADSHCQGEDVGLLAGIGACGITITELTAETLKASEAQVMVDFTKPDSVMDNCKLAIKCRVHPVIGTTGLTQAALDEIHELAECAGTSAFVAPNFAIGAILMLRFAQEAARYFPHVEILELHHDQKLDAPSGTALKTAALIDEVRPQLKQGNPNETEKLAGARGADFNGMRIHSVRLPGLIAHQEVIFGGLGQSLTIRHDAYSRETYMPGVILAIKTVSKLKGLVVGLENIL